MMMIMMTTRILMTRSRCEGGVPLLHPVDDDDYENNSDHDDDVHGVISNVVDNGIFKCSNERYTTAASSFCYCC